MNYEPPPAGLGPDDPYNVTATGGCDFERGPHWSSCEGVWLLPTDTTIDLTVFVDHTVAEVYWMDGRVAYTSGITYVLSAGPMLPTPFAHCKFIVGLIVVVSATV
jgi:hypothetical protein